MATFNVSKGFTSMGQTLSSTDTMNVYSGGRAVKIVLRGGRINVNNGATANSITINSCGYAAISYARVSNVFINSGSMNVYADSIAAYVTVKSGGKLGVSSGTARNVTVSGGSVDVVFRGNLSATTMNAGIINVGGTATGILMKGGSMYVSSGGTATGTLISGGTMRVSKGYAASTTVYSGGVAFTHSRGILDSSVVSSGGCLIADYSGVANYTTATDSGTVLVSNGGTASRTVVENGGSMNVYAGGTAQYTSVTCGGLADVRNGTANYTGVSSGGQLRVSGTANSTSVISGGNLVVCVGGVASATTVQSGGSAHVSSGGRAIGTVLSGAYTFSYAGNSQYIASGCLYVSSGGVATGTTAIAGAVYVLRGGTVNGTSIRAGGMIGIYGSATSTTVSSGGTLWISSGGTACDLAVSSGGTAFIVGGGKLTGNVVFGGTGAVVSAYSGAIIDFDISGVSSGADARIGNLSVLGGWNNAVFTVTMTTSQTGTYKLATGVSGFNKTITVVNTSGTQLATLTVGGRASIGSSFYTLDLTNGILSLRRVTDTNPPKVSNVRANTTSQTNKNVTVTASFSDNVGVASSLYRIGESGDWREYNKSSGVTVTENATVYFMAIDKEGNESTVVKYNVSNIDKVAPTVTDVKATTSSSKVVVTAAFQDNVAVTSSLYRIGSNGSWQSYSSKGVTLSENATVYFKALDKAGNESAVVSYDVTGIPERDNVAPTVGSIKASTNAQTRQSVTVTAVFDDDVAVTSSLYRIGSSGTWKAYPSKGVTVSENATIYFKAVDKAGNVSVIKSYTVSNIDKTAPGAPSDPISVTSSRDAALTWTAGTDRESGISHYIVTYNPLDGETFTAKSSTTNWVLKDLAPGAYSWSVQAVDSAGNKSAEVSGGKFVVSELEVTPLTQTWNKTGTAGETSKYTVEYSADNFGHILRLTVASNSLDAFQLPAGACQVRVKAEDGVDDDWSIIESAAVEPAAGTAASGEPQLVKSDSDGNMDVFFTKADGVWESGYQAKHVGSFGGWGGTRETVSILGRNRITDIIEGSTDANILLMTDDTNGDALFVDDIYSALPDTVAEQQARIARIDEIRAGAGDDVVDMTSQRFEYAGDGLTIRGGNGDDVIWANTCDNRLFGDAGNDRIVGASGCDVIAGGIGNDRMHGGGGNDVFTFCDNWGMDTIEQLATGTVTLWFRSGSMENWDASTLTYTDGKNSVNVSGTAADRITIKFGDDGSERYAALASAGAFLTTTSECVFEEAGRGIVA